MSDAKVALTAADLKEILKTVVEEARKPVITQKDQREMEEAQEARKRGKEQEDERVANEELTQRLCTHRRRDNTPRTVHVQNNPKSGGEFMICQKCQKVIRPELEPALFTSLIQDQAAVMD